MNGWMTHHGDGYRQELDNNEYKIRNTNKMDGWRGRHGDGCQYATYNNEYKIKNDINGCMDGWTANETDTGRGLIISNIK